MPRSAPPPIEPRCSPANWLGETFISPRGPAGRPPSQIVRSIDGCDPPVQPPEPVGGAAAMDAPGTLSLTDSRMRRRTGKGLSGWKCHEPSTATHRPRAQRARQAFCSSSAIVEMAAPGLAGRPGRGRLSSAGASFGMGCRDRGDRFPGPSSRTLRSASSHSRACRPGRIRHASSSGGSSLPWPQPAIAAAQAAL